MKRENTDISDVFVIETDAYTDERGFFFENYNQKKFSKLIKKEISFVQDNISLSKSKVLRGLHYQHLFPQGKLFRVLKGEVYDVAVDLRKNSPTFGRFVGKVLSDQNKLALWIPEGFAHGFVVLSEEALCSYKTTEYYHPEDEYCIRWDDPDISIDWPITKEVVISEKDRAGLCFNKAPLF